MCLNQATKYKYVLSTNYAMTLLSALILKDIYINMHIFILDELILFSWVNKTQMLKNAAITYPNHF